MGKTQAIVALAHRETNRIAQVVIGWLLVLLFAIPGGRQALAEGGATAPSTMEVEGRLRSALEATVASDRTQFPSAILYVSRPQEGAWVVAAGVADIETGAPLAPDARFRAGSILKPFVAAVVLQLVEEGVLSLDDTMVKLLPRDVTSRFSNSDQITLKMLLNHTSGIPDWLSESLIEKIGANPRKVWQVTEFLDLAATQPPPFAPGHGWGYSNTNYNLLGLAIERATGKPWREAVRKRVIERLGLRSTSLPGPGDTAIEGAFMHGYGLIDGKVVDLSFVDPSMADAGGGGALVTTVTDLAKFIAALRGGDLFANPSTFTEMADFVDAPGPGGQVGYGLGLEKYLLPGGLELIGHLGGTAGYRAFTGYFPQLELSMTFALSAQVDPTPVISAALRVMEPSFAP